MRLRLTSLTFSVLASFASAPLLAQDPLDEVYGHAVHSYFRGDVPQAQTLLDQVIEAGSVDPRVHYFRGLCLSVQSGGTDAGKADFQRGAELEIEGKKVVNVGKALERIQGAARCEIEEIRRKYRLDARDKYMQMQRLRYEEAQRTAPALPARDADAPPSLVPTPKDPFAPGLDLNKGTPVPMPDSKPTTPPADNNPFGDAPSDPGTTTPPPATDDPFGGPPPASDDDPFGN